MYNGLNIHINPIGKSKIKPMSQEEVYKGAFGESLATVSFGMNISSFSEFTQCLQSYNFTQILKISGDSKPDASSAKSPTFDMTKSATSEYEALKIMVNESKCKDKFRVLANKNYGSPTLQPDFKRSFDDPNISFTSRSKHIESMVTHMQKSFSTIDAIKMEKPLKPEDYIQDIIKSENSV